MKNNFFVSQFLIFLASWIIGGVIYSSIPPVRGDDFYGFFALERIFIFLSILTVIIPVLLGLFYGLREKSWKLGIKTFLLGFLLGVCFSIMYVIYLRYDNVRNIDRAYQQMQTQKENGEAYKDITIIEPTESPNIVVTSPVHITVLVNPEIFSGDTLPVKLLTNINTTDMSQSGSLQKTGVSPNGRTIYGGDIYFSHKSLAPNTSLAGSIEVTIPVMKDEKSHLVGDVMRVLFAY